MAVAAAASVIASPSLSRRDADRFQQKVVLIAQHGSVRRQAPRRTAVTEPELNAYLTYHARDQIPAGVVDPYISIVGAGRLVARAVVDLDVVRQDRGAESWLDPASYLTGRLPVSVTGVLEASDGVGRFEVEAAEISGVTVPKWVVQEIVSRYSRTSDDPDGLDIDASFELPARIKTIEVEKGQAIVVQ